MKKIGLVVVGIVLVGLGILLFNNRHILSGSANKPNSAPVDLAFAVLGDVHGNASSLQKALRDLHDINQRMDALVFNGDTVDQGTQQQYDAIEKLLRKNRSILPQTLIKNIGNHEFFDYEQGKSNSNDVQGFINHYLNFAGEAKVYHDTWMKGYHFISLGSEDGNSQTSDSVRAYISEAQRRWLTKTLAQNYVKGRPIFVFLHQTLNTNPNNGWIGTEQGDAIRKILSNYPEVFLFTSHTHADLTEKSVLQKQPFTMVHTGAVSYTIIRRPADQGGTTREPYIKGLYVEVNDNQVVVRGRDVKGKSWIFEVKI